MTTVQHKNDPSYGYTLESLLKIPAPAEPSDFAEFWRETYDLARNVPLNIAKRRSGLSNKQVAVQEIEFDSIDGVRVGGWITTPKDKPVQRLIVIGHGYGGRPEPALAIPGPPAAALFPCARGFHRSSHRQIPWGSENHVLHGIESRETYVHRGCAAEIWGAASALIELYPEAAGNLQYHGGSFGGGIGAMALPWDKRFNRGFLDVPSFGNHPLRLRLKCTGSGESVRAYYKKHPYVTEVLRYFDSAIAARHITIPVLVAAALRDGAVPPPGQFAVYNSLAGPKELFVRQSGHPTTSEDEPRLSIELDKWFSTLA